MTFSQTEEQEKLGFRQNLRGEDKEAEIKITSRRWITRRRKHINLSSNGRKTISVKIPKGIQPGGKIRLIRAGKVPMEEQTGSLSYCKV